ncbi:MAG: 6-bladed beta-propeller [bacterium]|nr:6-bladed beta-propeller [bacterium]
MKKIVLLVIIMSIMITNCTKKNEVNHTIEVVKGIKIFKNKNIPADKSLTFNLKELFQLKGVDENSDETPAEEELFWPRFLDIDSANNIYVIDYAAVTVKVYDKNGTFIKTIGRKGNGPGEFQTPYALAYLNNTLWVFDHLLQKTIKFDTEGNYTGDVKLKSLPSSLQPVGKDKFISFLIAFEEKEDGTYMHFDLILMNSQFEKIATLREYVNKFDPQINDLMERTTAYAVDMDKIFVAENSTERYRVNVFDLNGKQLYAIEKAYSPVLFPGEELDEYNDSLKQLYKKAGNAHFRPIKRAFKNTVNMMFFDSKNKYLLVAASQKRDQKNKDDFIVDVFKDGVYLNTVRLPVCQGRDFDISHYEKIFFKGNRIYHINEAEAVVKVFQY